MQKRGLILVTGATGSGKSTSLAAMLDHRNRNTRGHILTIEDPIEFVHQHQGCVITQREVGVDTASFAAGLKSALRQAPDVILIGEMRDIETVEAALHFSETGHLVLGTLHANNANQAVERFLNFFAAELHGQVCAQLSLNLRGIVSQRLIPRASGEGRVAAIEVMVITPRVADLVAKGEISTLKSAIEANALDGSQSFDMALFDLYRRGEITLEEALRQADSANNLRLRVKMAEAAAPADARPQFAIKRDVDEAA
jgi:twitching motility protein PilU